MSDELQKALDFYLSMQPFKSDPYHPGDHKRLFHAAYLAWKENVPESDFKDAVKKGLKEKNTYRDDLFEGCKEVINHTYQMLRFAKEFDILK